jgi:hypothetical protein
MKGFYRVANEHWEGRIADDGVAKEPKKKKNMDGTLKEMGCHEGKPKWALKETKTNTK